MPDGATYVSPRPAITLACSAGGSYPAPIDLDDVTGEQGMPA